MKAVIFAAGLGTRLYPYTKDRPKALVEMNGKPMLEHCLDRFQAMGIRDFVINIHAFADLVEQWIDVYRSQHPALNILVSDERDCLLETGGGLKKMRPYLEDAPFWVHNVDVWSDVDLASIQLKPGSLAGLLVRPEVTDRCFLFDQEGLLCGWENIQTAAVRMARAPIGELRRMGFTGMHVVSPAIFEKMEETGAFSITDVYLRLAATNEIYAQDIGRAVWFDVGTPDQLKRASMACV